MRPRSSPRRAALEQYRSRAPIYDLELAPAQFIRRMAIARLNLKRGAAVVDVGCGTGLSFEELEAQVGPQGTIVGIEQSPDMLALARQRVERNGWSNVIPIQSTVEDAAIAVSADAALFHFTHDIQQSERALSNVLRHLKPRARVVAAGLKWAPSWAIPVNLMVWYAALRSVTVLDGLSEPWARLARHLANFVVEPMLGGGTYIASGITRS
ncbi:MAG: class I SAM-dependent methyltransferase [Candidatus Binataceae bacterium]